MHGIEQHICGCPARSIVTIDIRLTPLTSVYQVINTCHNKNFCLGVIPLCGKIIYLLQIYNIFRRHNNMIYLLNFNITYIIIFATCFDFCDSSSGINFKNCCAYYFTVIMSYSFLSNYCNRDPFLHYKTRVNVYMVLGRGVVGSCFC